MKPCELHRSRRSRSSLEFPYYRATVTSLRPHFPRTVLHRGLISMPGFAIVRVKGSSLTVEVTSAHRVAASNGNGSPFFVYLGKLTAQRVYATLSVVKAEGMSVRPGRTARARSNREEKTDKSSALIVFCASADDLLCNGDFVPWRRCLSVD